MSYQRSTRYALYAAIEMAAAPANRLVTAAEVATKYALPPTVLAKIFQRLARAGLAIGARGTTGGYRLARPAAEVSVLEVVVL
ncbi:MAG TPA: Rrf2 family transcriptional regulator, partial [Thermoanaerobaculia bacterium]|nr:Rrf2 family transcriptional regulator [Thermoanaerobaculia bacterium]